MKHFFAITVLAVALFTPVAQVHAIFNFGCGTAGGAGAKIASGEISKSANEAISKAAAGKLGVPVDTISINAIQEEILANESTQTTKECVLDGLSSALGEALISQITDNIIAWINSGFEGGPAYVTNLNGFLGEIADNVSVDFIQGSELGFLCSPFELPIRQALATNYQTQKSFTKQISCSLGDVTGDIDGFLQGDFSQGGWKTWFNLATNPQNTPVGAYLLAESELNARVASKQNEQLTLLDYGNGFFTKGKCDTSNIETVDPEADYSTEFTCAFNKGEWTYVTPGVLAQEQLSKWLGVPADKLVVADEIDEIINALLAQLSQQLFTSLDGLRGLSSNSSSSSVQGQSYLRTLSNNANDTTLERARGVLIADINGAIGFEERYRGILDQVIVGYGAARDDFENLFQACIASGNTGAAGSASTTLSTGVIPVLSDYENQRAASVDTVAELIVIRGQAQTATTAEALNAAGDAYQAILDSGAVHIDSDSLFLIQERNAQQGTFDNFSIEVLEGLTACNTTL